MAVTAGALSLVSKTSTTVKAVSAAATAGTGPYTYQWYRSTDPAFVPGGGNILSGKTALALEDTGLIPGTQYYYKVVATDTGDSNATSTSAALAVQTALGPMPNPNQFQQAPYLGMIDMKFNPDTVAAQIDDSVVGGLYAGQAVKIVDSAGGVPKVVPITADSDEVFGFIQYNIKNKAYVAGDAVELSQDLNVIYLMSTAAISRGARVCAESSTIGGVQPVASGARIVGFAFDKATAAGQLIRVKVSVPSFQTYTP